MAGFSGSRSVSGQILRCAGRGMLKTDFVRKVAKLLLKSSKSEIVDVWLRDHERYLHCSATQAGTSASLEALGKEREFLSRKAAEVDEKHSSRLLVPVLAGRQRVGYLCMHGRRKDHFSQPAEKFYQEIADSLGFALMHVQLRSDLQERIKELTCLYGISRITAEPDTWLEPVLQRVVNILPAAWLYPDVAGARILLDGHAYTSPGHRDDAIHTQRTNIVVHGKHRGTVEITYSEARPELDEGPFLKEERRLIETVAEEMAAVVKRREAERDKLKLEDQLRHAERLATLGQLAAGLAHEINEPLSSAVGFAQLAKKCPDLPEQAGRDIDKVLYASLQAREIVRRLLTFTRQTPPGQTHVDLNRIVTEGLQFFESRCAKEGVELSCRLSSAGMGVQGDPTQLTQVFINLLVNALQAMPSGGILKIRTRQQSNQVSLIIEDTGVGMDREVLDNIFTPFFTTKDINEGTGLGLPVAHGIVTSHGGTLAITSNPGVGTKCVVKLPADETQKQSGDRDG